MAAPLTESEWIKLNAQREDAPPPPGQNSRFVIKRFHGLTDLFYAECTISECLEAHSHPGIPMDRILAKRRNQQQKQKEFKKKLKMEKNGKNGSNSKRNKIKFQTNNNKLKPKKTKFDWNHGTLYRS